MRKIKLFLTDGSKIEYDPSNIHIMGSFVKVEKSDTFAIVYPSHRIKSMEITEYEDRKVEPETDISRGTIQS